MLLGECLHCATPLRLTGNLGSLLLGRSYFCSNCGHPGPGLKVTLNRRIRLCFVRRREAVTRTAEETGNSLR